MHVQLWVKADIVLPPVDVSFAPKGDIGTRDHLDFIGFASSSLRRAWERIAIHVWDA
jgi:hypothetical protein